MNRQLYPSTIQLKSPLEHLCRVKLWYWHYTKQYKAQGNRSNSLKILKHGLIKISLATNWSLFFSLAPGKISLSLLAPFLTRYCLLSRSLPVLTRVTNDDDSVDACETEQGSVFVCPHPDCCCILVSWASPYDMTPVPISRQLFSQSSTVSKLPVKTALYTKPTASLISLTHLPAKRFHYQRFALCLVGALIYDPANIQVSNFC